MNSGYEKFFKEARRASGSGQKMSGQSLKAQNSNAQIADRLRQSKAARKSRKKSKFPLYPVLCGAALFALGVGIYLASDRLDEVLSKVEIGVFGQASAAESEKPAKGEKSAAVQDTKKEKTAESGPAVKNAEASNPKQWTAEEMSFFSKLSERKKELDLREAELGKLEEELQKRKVELDEKLKALEAMRTEISKTLKSRVSTDQEKVDKLVQVYSTMKAAQAAKVIETLNEDLAVEILDKMKKKNAAEILDMMNAKKARRLSEILTGYQRSTDEADEAEADVTKDTGKKDSAKEVAGSTAADKTAKK
jgi:flagellar motility protein MotE (MotC chaperone)